ncbi:MAG: hypothetical protein SNJ64_03025 [Endomicrobiia bacterium]
MNHHQKNKILFFIITIFIITKIVHGQEIKEIKNNPQLLFKDKFALGISIEETLIPLLRTKFKITSKIYAEARFGVANETKGEDLIIGIFLFGTRFYHILKYPIQNQKFNNVKLYWGIETDYLNIKHMSAELGSGYVGGCFVGVEKFLTKNLSLNTDLSCSLW